MVCQSVCQCLKEVRAAETRWRGEALTSIRLFCSSYFFVLHVRACQALIVMDISVLTLDSILPFCTEPADRIRLLEHR